MGIVYCEWGLKGIESLLDRASVFVIVDVLSFSTAVDVAVSQGVKVYPFPFKDQLATEQEANRIGTIAALPRKAAGGQYSLSPQSLSSLSRDEKLLLPSPNGSRLSLKCRETPVIAGCLRNAKAIGSFAAKLAGNGNIAVIAAGELWEDGNLRPAIEDWLGAGAICHATGFQCSAEAQLAASTFAGVEDKLTDLISTSISGLELADRGFSQDVEMAVQLNVSATVPQLIDGAYQNHDRSGQD